MHHSIYHLPPVDRPAKFESDQIGKFRERAFIHAWQDITAWPDWMIRAPSKASKTEDEHLGIDVYIHTDIGDIPVQIKGSLANCRDYAEKRHNGVTTIIIMTGNSSEEIRHFSIKHLKRAYEITKHRLRMAQRAALANT